ncbi:nucleotide exchange factor GrpE [Pseudonocardia acaciae]|uniref:nucleotide exchange factor GrpE n=1 Tax=Pseudonocardia acaciae TaxID=551276 RepID=UPI001FE1B963|nr:nucleotide exchange factor GrpE [Pseudonocardia acaciae]
MRDRRRIDPLTGEVRKPESAPADSGPGGPPGAAPVEPPAGADPAAETKLAELAAQLDERTADLQRVSAEYANYRRRVDRDREAITVAARAKVVGELLTVLDDLDRADAHGDLTGAFKAVADKLANALKGVGLEPFGTTGDPFDPAVHEAVQHATSPEVAGPTVTMVLRKGYRLGERVLRPAMVMVTDREPDAPDLPNDVLPGNGAENENRDNN